MGRNCAVQIDIDSRLQAAFSSMVDIILGLSDREYFLPNHWSKKVAFPLVLHCEETSVWEEIVQLGSLHRQQD